jgi:hypothetical protein
MKEIGCGKREGKKEIGCRKKVRKMREEERKK